MQSNGSDEEEFTRFLQDPLEERERRRRAEPEAYGIFPRKSFLSKDLERVLKTAEPIPSEPIEVLDPATGETRSVSRQHEIERRLSALSAGVLYSEEQKKLTPSDLTKRFHAIAAAADKLLDAISESPIHVRDELGRAAESEIAKDESMISTEGGAPQNTPLSWRAGTITSTDYVAGDIRFRNNVYAVAELRDWAKLAKKEAQARVKRNDGRNESRADLIVDTDAVGVILRIWEEVLQRELNTGIAVKLDGHAYGSQLEFLQACLAAVGITKPLTLDAIRGRVIRQRGAVGKIKK
jgi:hypothetical protein